tara:strand:- start:13541 stop:14335 length:795 start_codon:yes stop_codon:yes gene_type:complete
MIVQSPGVYGPKSFVARAPELMQNNLVVLYTPMHTATTFIRRMLERHSERGTAMSWDKITENHKHEAINLASDSFHIIQIHMHIGDATSIQPCQGTLFSLLDQALCRAYPTIITTRDPLATLITHYVRVKQQNLGILPEHLKRSVGDNAKICLYAAKLAEHGIGLHLAVEPVKTQKDRERFISGMFSYIDRPLFAEKRIEEAVTHWKKLNTVVTSDHPMRKAYNDQNLEYLLEHLPGVQYVLDHRSTFIPYLSKLGYRDLFWWK